MSTKDNVSFWIIFCLILSISTLDMYLLIKFQNVIIDTEKNFIGIWLIELDSGSIALFSAIKMFGTCLSLMLLKKIFIFNKKYGYTIGISIATFQILLLVYLFH